MNQNQAEAAVNNLKGLLKEAYNREADVTSAAEHEEAGKEEGFGAEGIIMIILRNNLGSNFRHTKD